LVTLGASDLLADAMGLQVSSQSSAT